uniref:Uncharacterized protein n=1 Tax=Physcomitrium patens TaxID=3218 RepID=A0A2K1IW64_PHYPA|nr:hypothetical protein PHYPA_025461 [Physcomitrium patens]
MPFPVELRSPQERQVRAKSRRRSHSCRMRLDVFSCGRSQLLCPVHLPPGNAYMQAANARGHPSEGSEEILSCGWQLDMRYAFDSIADVVAGLEALRFQRGAWE